MWARSSSTVCPTRGRSAFRVPSANFLVKYTKKETGNALDGNSALELATHNYGRDEWWLLLDPV